MEEKKKYRQNEWEKGRKERIVLLTDVAQEPTKSQIKLAAAAAGQSVNAWILDAIRDKLS